MIEKAFVPTLAIFELAFFLVKHGQNLELLGKIITEPKIEVIPNDISDILYLTWYSSLVRSCDDVSDLMILSAARSLGIELKTFDEDMEKLARS